ncbi:MAG: hypothetical protein WCO60_04515 [Verrucomicrobiota bacterium]
MNIPERFSELWNDYLEGEISPDALTELRSLLASDPSLEKLAADLYQLHRSLGYVASAEVSAEAFVADTIKRIALSKTEFVPRVMERINEPTLPEMRHPSTWSWFNSMIRPLAAGLVIGGLSVSMLWAYTAPVAVTRVLSLLDVGGSDFGTKNVTVNRGFPTQVGVWGGDPADFIEPRLVNGVVDMPALQNKPWLRFIRTAADQPGLRANSCDVFQIIDLRHILATANGLETTIEFSARFADRSAAETPHAKVGCQIYFFRGTPDTFTQDWPNQVPEAASFTANHTTIARSTKDFVWTPVSVKATPPPDAQFAVLQLSSKLPGGDHPFEEKPLGNHFVDSLSLTIKTQPSLPIQLAKKL